MKKTPIVYATPHDSCIYGIRWRMTHSYSSAQFEKIPSSIIFSIVLGGPYHNNFKTTNTRVYSVVVTLQCAHKTDSHIIQRTVAIKTYNIKQPEATIVDSFHKTMGSASSSTNKVKHHDTTSQPTPSQYPIVGPNDIMSRKRHGTSNTPVQESLRWNVSRKKADQICNFNRHFAEPSGKVCDCFSHLVMFFHPIL